MAPSNRQFSSAERFALYELSGIRKPRSIQGFWKSGEIGPYHGLSVTSYDALLAPTAHPACHIAALLLRTRLGHSDLSDAVARVVSSTPAEHALTVLRAVPSCSEDVLVFLIQNSEQADNGTWTREDDRVELLGSAMRILSLVKSVLMNVLVSETSRVPALLWASAVVATCSTDMSSTHKTNRARPPFIADDQLRLICEALLAATNRLVESQSLTRSLMLGLALCAPKLASSFSVDVRDHLMSRCLEEMLTAGPRTFLAKAACVYGHPSKLLAVFHDHAVNCKGPRRSRQLRRTFQAVLEELQASNVLQSHDCLVSVDALSLLNAHSNVSDAVLYQKVLWLGARITSDNGVLDEAGDLVHGVLRSPAGSSGRLLPLLDAVAAGLLSHSMSIVEYSQSSTDRKTAPSTLWMSVFEVLRQNYLRKELPEEIVSAAAATCTGIISAGFVASSEVSPSLRGLWNDLLGLYSAGYIEATTLAFAQDHLFAVKGVYEDVEYCLYRLSASAKQWQRKDFRRAAVTLSLRAALKCDLGLLTRVLNASTALVRREHAEDVAKHAVLHADAARKGDFLEWYFRGVLSSPSKDTERARL